MDNLLYKVEGIEAKQFAYDVNNFIPDSEIELSAQFNFPVNIQLMTVGCSGKYLFEQNGRTVAEVEIVVYFKIEENSFRSFYKGSQLILPVAFLQNIAYISLGTARGVIWDRLENTPLSKFILPAVNVRQIVNKDCYLNLSNTSSTIL